MYHFVRYASIDDPFHDVHSAVGWWLRPSSLAVHACSSDAILDFRGAAPPTPATSHGCDQHPHTVVVPWPCKCPCCHTLALLWPVPTQTAFRPSYASLCLDALRCVRGHVATGMCAWMATTTHSTHPPVPSSPQADGGGRHPSALVWSGRREQPQHSQTRLRDLCTHGMATRRKLEYCASSVPVPVRT